MRTGKPGAHNYKNLGHIQKWLTNVSPIHLSIYDSFMIMSLYTTCDFVPNDNYGV